MKSGVIFLLKYAWKNNKAYLYALTLNQLVKSSIPILTIIFPKIIFDALTVNQMQFSKLLIYSCVYLGSLFILLSLDKYLWRLTFKKRAILYRKFQLDLGQNLVDSDLEQLESSEFLSKREKAYKFIYADGQGFGFVLDRAFNIISKTLVFVGVLIVVSRLSILVTIIFIGISFINNYISLLTKKKYVTHELEKSEVERRAGHYSSLIEDFRYAKEIRINSISNWILKKMGQLLNESNIFYKKQMDILLGGEVFQFFGDLIKNILAYAFLLYSISRGTITIGDFAMYLAAITTFSLAMNELMDSVTDIQKFGGYFEAVQEYLNLEKKLRLKTDSNINTIGKLEKIEFKNVSFKYAGQERYALKGINAVLYSGQKYSLVGENGAGKSTFAKLLCRLYDPTDGEILCNGVNIKNIDYDEYMKLFSAVFQDFKLFSTSLRENICFDNEATDSQLVNMIQKINLSNLYNKLPFGLNTSIYKDFDASGFEPSGGEGQKIAITRALHKNANIIILDEPTASLDPRAESEIFENFNNLVSNKTALYITHRLASVKFSDCIIVLNEGEIIESGSHQYLIANEGLYSELYKMQADLYI
ncbi:MAG: ABC transporter ATP-binding protein/permease [Lachnospiraceae bacterium]|nr:ABC transporter ATP-binding protein/permease [Lachnospiraceae bacterium]